MKKLDYRFFYYKTRAAYLSDKAYDRIPNDAIVFVEEGRYIITHDTEYKCSDDPSSPTTIIGDLLQMMFDKKQDKLIAGDNITIEGNVISATGTGGGSVDFSDLSDTQKSALERAIKEMLDESGNESLIEKIIAKIIEQSGNDGSTLIDQIVLNIISEINEGNIDLIDTQTINNLTNEEKNALADALADKILNILKNKSGDYGVYSKSEVYAKSETYDKDTIDRKVSTAAAGTTQEALNNAISTYLQNNASDIFNGYVTTEDLNGYAKTGDIPALLTEGDGIDISNNVVSFDVDTLNSNQKNALKTALGVNEGSSNITYEELP